MDAVWKFVAPVAGEFQFEVVEGAAPIDDICVVTSCGGGEVLATQSNSLGITVALASDQVVYVAVDNDGEAKFGTVFGLSVEMIPPIPSPIPSPSPSPAPSPAPTPTPTPTPSPSPSTPPSVCLEPPIAFLNQTTDNEIGYVSESFPCSNIRRLVLNAFFLFLKNAEFFFLSFLIHFLPCFPTKWKLCGFVEIHCSSYGGLRVFSGQWFFL